MSNDSLIINNEHKQKSYIIFERLMYLITYKQKKKIHVLTVLYSHLFNHYNISLFFFFLILKLDRINKISYGI